MHKNGLINILNILDFRLHTFLDYIVFGLLFLNVIIFGLSKWHKGGSKPIAVMNLKDWEQYRNSVKEVLQALYYAYKRLKLLEQTQKDTITSFDEYIKKEVLAYDSEEFEREREHFETQCIDSSEVDIEL